MANRAHVLRKTAVGGFLVILPVAIMVVMFTKTMHGIGAFLGPVAGLFPDVELAGLPMENLLAAGLIVLASFVVGLAVETRLGMQFGRFVENLILRRIPTWTFVKGIVASLGGTNADQLLRPAVISMPGGGQLMAFSVERHDDGTATVFLPSSPAPTSGTLQRMPVERVREVDVSVKEMFECISRWGVGSARIFSAADRPPDEQLPPA
jgi:uncharacterized membrane protein